jgi:hypothetical protein
MKAIVRLKSFPGHKGIPGHQGGSLPENAGSTGDKQTQSDKLNEKARKLREHGLKWGNDYEIKRADTLQQQANDLEDRLAAENPSTYTDSWGNEYSEQWQHAKRPDGSEEDDFQKFIGIEPDKYGNTDRYIHMSVVKGASGKYHAVLMRMEAVTPHSSWEAEKKSMDSGKLDTIEQAMHWANVHAKDLM